MDSQTVHLADVCFRFQGAHDESVEVLCSRFVLHEASPVLREALGIEFIEGAKRNADGLMILAMANARLTCGAVRDALVFIHQGKLPETWERWVGESCQYRCRFALFCKRGKLPGPLQEGRIPGAHGLAAGSGRVGKLGVPRQCHGG